ncbi:MAG: DNA translocase FtsK 4TM domain-containing protein [Deltaproteobacteria bacterium]|nr:DNA translocase FtsK 4TM domain-containing protein [Deltaproteobacteria bacterium]
MSTASQRARTPQSRELNIKREMWGIVLLGISLLLGGALFSLQMGDGKLMGPFGQLMALGLYAVFGMGSYLVIGAVFSISWGIFTRRFNLRDARLWLGYSGATLSGTVLMFLMFPSYRLQGLSSGGKTGEYIGTLGISLFSKVGTFLVTGILMVLFLVVATQTSPTRAVKLIFKWVLTVSISVAAGLGVFFRWLGSLFTWEPLDEYEETDEDDERLVSDIEDKKKEIDISVKSSDAETDILTDEKESSESVKKVKSDEKKLPKPAVDDLCDAADTGEKESDQYKEVVEEEKTFEIAVKDEDSDEVETAIAAKDILTGIKIHEVVKTEVKKISIPENENSDEFSGEFILPDIDMLHYEAPENENSDHQAMIDLADRLVTSMSDYKIRGKVEEIHPGPVVTMYEFVPEAGIRVSKIESLDKDLALSLAATRVRIVAPIPGKGAVGIEVPNDIRQTVFLKELITADVFTKSKSKLTMVLGKDIKGRPIICDLAKAPHLLVAGSTGSGKSVGINTMIMSILFRATPEDVKFIFIDPKMVELSIYNDIPHLLLPVVTDPGKASLALQWAVKEMERRYQLLADLHVRNLADYNRRIESIAQRGIEEIPEHLPAIVIVIDEFADLMMVAAKEVEIAVARIAQKARAVGIHLIVATQRPSTDVITGLIKSNFPTRIAFMVSSRIDSKVVLDKHGAETLLGNGDMLYADRGLAPVRVHGSFVSTSEVQKVVEHLRTQGLPSYDMSIVKNPDEELLDASDEPLDSKWDLAVDIVSRDRIASISYLQRKLKIGYNRAARIVERMEIEGVVSRPNHQNQREVLISAPPD